MRLPRLLSMYDWRGPNPRASHGSKFTPGMFQA
jgi:hypothetical protein